MKYWSLITSVLFVFSCHKEQPEVVKVKTSIHLSAIDVLNNMPLSSKEIRVSAENGYGPIFHSWLDQDGNIDTTLSLESYCDFRIGFYGLTDYIVLGDSDFCYVTGGSNAILNFEVCPAANLKIILDCNLPGGVDDVCWKLIPLSLPVYGYPQCDSLSYFDYNAECGEEHNRMLIPGLWKIEYTYKPYVTYSSVTVVDTLILNANEVLNYTIQF